MAKPPVEERWIALAERKLGVTLPSGYRERMMASNGGLVVLAPESGRTCETEIWLHPIRDESTTERLRRTCNDIAYETNVMRGYPDWPAGFVAIGDAGGDSRRLAIDCGAPEPDMRLLLWDPDDLQFEEVQRPWRWLQR